MYIYIIISTSIISIYLYLYISIYIYLYVYSISYVLNAGAHVCTPGDLLDPYRVARTKSPNTSPYHVEARNFMFGAGHDLAYWANLLPNCFYGDVDYMTPKVMETFGRTYPPHPSSLI